MLSRPPRFAPVRIGLRLIPMFVGTLGCLASLLLFADEFRERPGLLYPLLAGFWIAPAVVLLWPILPPVGVMRRADRADAMLCPVCLHDLRDCRGSGESEFHTQTCPECGLHFDRLEKLQAWWRFTLARRGGEAPSERMLSNALRAANARRA